MLELRNITKDYSVGEEKVHALKGVSLAFRENEFVSILGQSGCGKTTLLNIIGGLDVYTDGDLIINGRSTKDFKAADWDAYRNRRIGFVFQSYNLIPHLTVLGNVELALTLSGVRKSERQKRAAAALARVGLEKEMKKRPNQMSGGQMQRVAIARAIVCEPKVLLLDEPLGALDLKMRKEMQLELAAMHKDIGITFIYVTHDQEEALTMSDKVVVMTDGAVQQYGTPKKIYDEPANAFVADFIGESNILSGVMKKDFLVEFCDTQFKCSDKGFGKDERVDLVVRPEDIAVDPKKGALKGEVVSTVFKGTYYEMEIMAAGYQFTVQNTVERAVGETVWLSIEPDGIHIMKKLKTVNEYDGEITAENTVKFCGGEFEFAGGEAFERGDEVRVSVPFDKIDLTDDEADGVIGANVTQTLYKGSYYQVQVYTDDDNDFLIDTVDEWDIGDRVGIKIDPRDLTVTRKEKEQETEPTSASAEAEEGDENAQ